MGGRGKCIFVDVVTLCPSQGLLHTKSARSCLKRGLAVATVMVQQTGLTIPTRQPADLGLEKP